MLSMTGFGKTEIERDGRRVRVEIKTVNNRFLDIIPKYPRAFISLDEFPDDDCEYDKIPYDVVECDKHVELNRKMAQESMVLLKNNLFKYFGGNLLWQRSLVSTWVQQTHV